MNSQFLKRLGVVAAVALLTALGGCKTAVKKDGKDVDTSYVDAKVAATRGRIPMENILRYGLYSDLKLSPTGKYFLAIGTKPDNRAQWAAVIDRKTMKVISTLPIEGRSAVCMADWIDEDTIMAAGAYDFGQAEDTACVGPYISMKVDGSHKKMIWDNHSTSYGAGGMQMIGKPDADGNVFAAVSTTGGGYGDMPYGYLYKLNVYSGKAHKIMRSPVRGPRSWVIDRDGNVTHVVGTTGDDYDATVVATRQSDGSWSMQTFANSRGRRLPLRYSPDGKYLWIASDLEAPTMGYYKRNLETGEETLIYRNPRVDPIRTAVNDADEMWGVVIMDGYPEMIYLDENAPEAKVRKKVAASFPDKWVRITSRAGDESIIHVMSDTDPGKYYIYNAYDETIKFLLDPYPWLDREQTNPMNAFKLRARDGLLLNGYLTLPKGVEPKNLPLIVHPHGGPFGPRDYWGYYREAQVLANAGYAVLQLDYRGSGGYGREFMYSGYREWGGKMQDDLTDATHWAVQQGIADPKRMCISGASYGGYASLMGVVKEPDLYACASGYVGVYDLPLWFTEGDVPLSKSGLKYLHEALADSPEGLIKNSPAHNVDKIKAKLLLIMGKRDVRVPSEQYWSLTGALDKRGYPYESLVFDNAAHGVRDYESMKLVYATMIEFFDKHIGPATVAGGNK